MEPSSAVTKVEELRPCTQGYALLLLKGSNDVSSLSKKKWGLGNWKPSAAARPKRTAVHGASTRLLGALACGFLCYDSYEATRLDLARRQHPCRQYLAFLFPVLQISFHPRRIDSSSAPTPARALQRAIEHGQQPVAVSIRPGTRAGALPCQDAHCWGNQQGQGQGQQMRIAECIVGDDTGVIVFTARNEQVDVMKVGATVEVKNAKVDMYKGSMRLAVDRRGTVKAAESPAEVKVKEDNNLSLIEFEQVTVVM